MATAQQYATAYETTQKVSNTPPIGFNKPYLKTIPCIIKIVELLSSFIAVICISAWIIKGQWFVDLVFSLAMILTAVLFIFYLTNIIYKLMFTDKMPFILFIEHAVTTVLVLICFIILAAQGAGAAAIGASAFFAFLALAAYGFDTFLYFEGYRSQTLLLRWMPNPDGAGGQADFQAPAEAGGHGYTANPTEAPQY